MSVARPDSPHRAARMTAGGAAKALPLAARDLTYVLVAVSATWFAWLTVRWGFGMNVVGFDFEGTLWEPGRAILDGRNPYPEPVVSELEVGNPAVYPPLLMILAAPLASLSWNVAVALWIGVLATAVLGSLYIVGVRDVRCYALAFVSVPVLMGLMWGNATLLLVPLVALAWVWRDRWLYCGAVVALAVASKLLVWPLLVWLVAARRYRAAGVALGGTVAAILLPWALIGFRGIATYPELLRTTEDFFAVHSFSVATILSAFGADPWIAARGALAVGLAIAAAAFVVGRRGLDAESMTLAVLAAVLGSPIVWPFYFALLLVPLAIARPRFSAAWMMFPLFMVAVALPRPRMTASDLAPGGVACCRPEDVPRAVWIFNHAPSGLWPALGCAALAVAIVAVAIAATRRQQAADEPAPDPA